MTWLFPRKVDSNLRQYSKIMEWSVQKQLKLNGKITKERCWFLYRKLKELEWIDPLSINPLTCRSSTELSHLKLNGSTLGDRTLVRQMTIDLRQEWIIIRPQEWVVHKQVRPIWTSMQLDRLKQRKWLRGLTCPKHLITFRSILLSKMKFNWIHL